MNGRDRLAQWIERSKLTQFEAAGVIGLNHTHLSKIMNNERRPGLDAAIKIERATGIVVETWESIEDEAEATVCAAETGKRRLTRR